MIESRLLYTGEIDDPEAAVHEIEQQMNQVNLLKNSVGMVVCHSDYVENGTVAALAELLPFSIAGYTTFSHVTAAGGGEYDLSVTILTSDDVRFAVTQSAPVVVGEDLYPPLQAVYQAGIAGFEEKPAFIMNFGPLDFEEVVSKLQLYLRKA